MYVLPIGYYQCNHSRQHSIPRVRLSNNKKKTKKKTSILGFVTGRKMVRRWELLFGPIPICPVPDSQFKSLHCRSPDDDSQTDKTNFCCLNNISYKSVMWICHKCRKPVYFGRCTYYLGKFFFQFFLLLFYSQLKGSNPWDMTGTLSV